MSYDEKIIINTSNLQEKIDKIPPEDFINEKYDQDYKVRTSDVLVILSTERSGSTLLSDILSKNKVCLAHEYFQLYDYMPLLAVRWSCLHNNVLDGEAYVRNLLRYRTYPSGWLGINLHGAHLKNFISVYNYFSVPRFHYVHLMRRDIISQAVSFDIASQTGQWSSDFQAHSEPVYSYNNIWQKLQKIQNQNSLIRAFITGHRISCQTIYYEDIVEDPKAILATLPCIDNAKTLVIKTSLQKQSNNRNKEWIHRFASEYLDRNGEPRSSPISRDKGIFEKVIAIIKRR